MNKNGFTLIELLAVLVVLAILALISIPITIRIINQSRENSYKRSIANYAKALENYIALKNMDNASNDYSLLSNLVNKVDKMYTGNRVSCDFSSSSNTDDDYSTLIKGKLVLRGCTVNNNEQTYKYEDGKVEIQQVYDLFSIGQSIKVNGKLYYVINKDGKYKDYVVALKDAPLKVEQVNTYGVGYINRYTNDHVDTVYDINGYGGLTFYSSETCGIVNGRIITSDCDNDYRTSDIRHVVDNWGIEEFKKGELKEVALDGYGSYKARLLTVEDMIESGAWKVDCCSGDSDNLKSIRYVSSLPFFINFPYYWTMSNYKGLNMDRHQNKVFYIDSYGFADPLSVYSGREYVVRPVINVYKDKIDKE